MAQHTANPRRRAYAHALVLTLALYLASLIPTSVVRADPGAPYWSSGSGAAVHYLPVAWPNDASWTPYSTQGGDINDPRTADPSNGGTAPQNHANISSSCIDTTLPSVYYRFDPATQRFFMRWRVETLANTYATGPSAGVAASTDPWQSALWTVLIDTDGDGYREFAIHLNGSSGSPSQPIDTLAGIYSNSASQSIDYINDPNVHLLGHNPTAFLAGDGSILNFKNSYPTSQPVASWPNGSNETVWDYGTTRATQLVKSSSCDEYLIDYQFPLAILDASAYGGPKVTASTPLSFIFVTSNSLNNPLQKDAVITGSYIADPTRPAPFGDVITPEGAIVEQPIVQGVSAAGCGPTRLTAQINDAVDYSSGSPQTTVSSVEFLAYADKNADGLANDGGGWAYAANGSTTNSPLGQWAATWDSSALLQGQYLIGVKATDRQGNVTYSYLSQAEVDALGLGAQRFANPDTTGIVNATFRNSCGLPPPYLTKVAGPAQVTVGATTTFTLTVHNTTASTLAIADIVDTLPTGFKYATTAANTIGTTTAAPAADDTGTLTWTFQGGTTVPAGSQRELVFTAVAPAVAGTFTNVATANTGSGALTSQPAQIDVGQPRLTIGKTASPTSAAPGQTITYTISYANDSAVSVTGAMISDVLPLGLTYVAAPGGSYDGATRTVSWSVGDIAAGDGPFSVSLVATVDSPYPAAAAIPLVNTATIDAPESAPSSASVASYISAPRPALHIQKDAGAILVSAGTSVTYTLSYANSGNAPATTVVITDPIPTGWSFVSATGGGTNVGGVVTWNVGAVNPGGSGSVAVTLTASNPYTGTLPAVNTATIAAGSTSTTATDSFTNGVTTGACVQTNYYFQSSQIPIDSGSYRTATTAPLSTATATALTVTGTNALQEIIRFYQDPPTTSAVNLSGGTITTNFYLTKGSTGLDLLSQVYVFDPNTGSKSPIGSSTATYPGTPLTNEPITATVTLTDTLPAGKRLLWVFSGNINTNKTITFLYGGTNSPSKSYYCIAQPATPVLDKQVSKLAAVAGDTLTYTLKYGNYGNADLTGVQLLDALPTGLSFVSASGGGAYDSTTRTVIWSPGIIAAGASGSVVLTATVDSPLGAGVFSLGNTATLKSTGNGDITDAAATAIMRPNVGISKTADKTLLLPGDTVTYTITALNAGAGAATNVTIADALPANAYFTYVPNSTKLNGAAVTPDPVASNNLTVSAGTLAASASATVTFQMKVGTTSLPAGVTPLANTASVSDAQTPGSRASDPVTVSVSTIPNLKVVKTATPAGTLAPGDVVTYTLTVSNAGYGAATDVFIQDPIPNNTAFVAGSFRDGGASKTDAADGDNATYDPAGNRVLFDLGDLAAGATRTLSFAARVAMPLAAGTTSIVNTASASAGNTAPKQGSVTSTAVATPTLTLLKSAPSTVPYPLTALATSASNSSTVTVASAAYIAVNDVIRIGGTSATVTAIAGETITLSSPITAALGSPVVPTFEYVLNYANSGDADAHSVTVSDTLPAGLALVSAEPTPAATTPAVTWGLGTVAAGASGTLRVCVYPTGAGSFTNSATISSAETGSQPSNSTTTTAGTLLLTKSTATPRLVNTPTGAQATYTITLTNQLPTAATGVVVTDILPAGFTYASTTGWGGNASRTATVDPVTTGLQAQQPTWGTWTIPGNGALTITFVANVAASVGPAIYQNEVMASSADTAVTPFDALGTDAEDVEVRPAAPFAADNSGSTEGTAPRALDLPANDTAYDPADLERDSIDLDLATPLTHELSLTVPGKGTWVLGASTGVVTFTADVGFTGVVTFPYTIRDNYGSISNQATVTVTVTNPLAPTALPDTATTTGTLPVAFDGTTYDKIAANDSAGGNGAALVPSTIDLDPSTPGTLDASYTQAGKGTWVLEPSTGVVTFTAVAGFSGDATIPYTIRDNYGTLSNQANLTVTVSKPDAPTALPDTATTTGTLAVVIEPLDNDMPGSGATVVRASLDLDPLTAGQQTSMVSAGKGAWSLNTSTGEVTFTPFSGFMGTAVISYTIADSFGTLSNVTTISVTVSAPAPPDATDNSTSTTGTIPVTLTPAGDDTAYGGATVVASTIDLDPSTPGTLDASYTQAGKGTWVLEPSTGVVTFTAVVSFTGPVSIPYTIRDNYGSLSDAANLIVTVNPPAKPAAVGNSATITGTDTAAFDGSMFALLASNDTAGGDGAALVPASIDLDPTTPGTQDTTHTEPLVGTWTLSPSTGVVTFTAAPSFSGTAVTPYTIQDTYGSTSNQALISVTVNKPAQPTAYDDTATTTGTDMVAFDGVSFDTIAVNDTAGGHGATLVPNSIDLDPNAVEQQTTRTTANGIWSLDTLTGVVSFQASPGFSGTTSISYTIEDNYGQTSNVATLTVTVDKPAPPQAIDDSTSTTGTTAATLIPASTDQAGGSGADLDASTIDLDPSTGAQDELRVVAGVGTWVLDKATGIVTFTADPAFVPNPGPGPATATITYTIRDTYGQLSNAANLTVDVFTPPSLQANPDAATTTGTKPATLPAPDNDVALGVGINLVTSTIDLFPDDPAFPASSGLQDSRATAEGSWSLDTTTGVVTFTPKAGFSGTAIISYTIQNNAATPQTSNQASLTVLVNKPAPPEALGDTATTTGTLPVVFDGVAFAHVLANDAATTETGAELVTATLDLNPATPAVDTDWTTSQGHWSLDPATGTVTFVAVAGFKGDATLLYLIKDNYGQHAEATITITVKEPPAPVASDDSKLAPGTVGTNAITLTLPLNDTAGGDGAILVTDTIDLDPTSAEQDTALETAEGMWVLDTVSGVVTFTPAPGFTGDARTPYTIKDNYGALSNEADLVVRVTKPADPRAFDDSATTTGTDPVALPAPGNDQAGGDGAVLEPGTLNLDPSTTALETTIVVTGTGTWTRNSSTGMVTFTAALGFSGVVTMPYTIDDNYRATSNEARLKVTVNRPGAPTAVDDSVQGSIGLTATLDAADNDLASGQGAALDPASIDLDPSTPATQDEVYPTPNGTWALDKATGKVTFTPKPTFFGTDRILYTVKDNYGSTSNEASLSVLIPTPPAPIASDDTGETIGTAPVTLDAPLNDKAGWEGASLVTTSLLLDVTPNGLGPVSVVTAKGTWTLDPATGKVTFVAVVGFTGTATMPYTIQDNFGLTSNTANLIVQVRLPATPQASNDRVSSSGAAVATLHPVTNDAAGGNGAALVVDTIDLDPATPGQQTTRTTAQGTWSLDRATGDVTFTPAAGFTGTASTPYTIRDNYGQISNTATLTVDVLPPTAVALIDFRAARQGEGVTVRWVTGAELNTWGFHLYRSADGKRGSAIRVTARIVPAAGRGQGGATYIWLDADVQPGVTYSYWLEEVELDGDATEYGPVSTAPLLDEIRYHSFLPLVTR